MPGVKVFAQPESRVSERPRFSFSFSCLHPHRFRVDGSFILSCLCRLAWIAQQRTSLTSHLSLVGRSAFFVLGQIAERFTSLAVVHITAIVQFLMPALSLCLAVASRVGLVLSPNINLRIAFCHICRP